MVILLLITTFLIALVVATVVVLLFARPMEKILKRVVPEDISPAWVKYLKFAIYVVGIGGGVRVWDFEKYLTPMEPYREIVQLTVDRWMLEIYQTIIGTLQSTAMVLLVFFVFALIAVVIVRVFETRGAGANAQKTSELVHTAS
jgi:flagellar biosynthesis/type III secretory pathway M-ring protein FliF/YscJ